MQPRLVGVRDFVVYTLARIALFVAAYAVTVGVYALVTDDSAVPVLWPLLVAIVVSSIASVYLLRGLRERFVDVVQRRAAAASQRFEASRAKEDDPQGRSRRGNRGREGA